MRPLGARVLLALGFTALLLLAAACAGAAEEDETSSSPSSDAPTTAPDTPTTTPDTPTPAPAETAPSGIEAGARTILADETGEDRDSFTLVSEENVDWSDASLGCPQEGFGYAQVITPGYKLVFELEGESYVVHTNADGSHMVLCEDD